MDQSTASSKQNTREIQPDEWNLFLAEFTHEHRGAHARLEVIGSDVGYQVETENRPFDGIAADIKHGERIVWIHFASTPEDQLTHGIHNATRIYVSPLTEKVGTALEVETRDGGRTVLELSSPEEYALPPGGPPTLPG